MKKSQEGLLASHQELDAANKAAEALQQKTQSSVTELEVKEKELISQDKKVRTILDAGTTTVAQGSSVMIV